MKNPWVIIAIVTVVLFGGAIFISNNSSNAANEGVELMAHVKGNSEAGVDLVKYSDFQCPACAAFQPVVKDLVDQYGDSMSYEYKHFPLSNIHPHAVTAAVAAEAAGQQGKFFEMHDLIFENQAEWSRNAIPSAAFVGYAEQIGLDMEQYTRQTGSSVLRDKVRAEFADGRELDITGTPTFFLNGQRMEFNTFEEFTNLILAAIDPTSIEAVDGVEVPVAEPEVRFGI